MGFTPSIQFYAAPDAYGDDNLFLRQRSAEFIPQPNAAPNVAPTCEVPRSGMIGPARQSLALRLLDKICAFNANAAR